MTVKELHDILDSYADAHGDMNKEVIILNHSVSGIVEPELCIANKVYDVLPKDGWKTISLGYAREFG